VNGRRATPEQRAHLGSYPRDEPILRPGCHESNVSRRARPARHRRWALVEDDREQMAHVREGDASLGPTTAALRTSIRQRVVAALAVSDC
jgi:hypothetical protein